MKLIQDIKIMFEYVWAILKRPAPPPPLAINVIKPNGVTAVIPVAEMKTRLVQLMLSQTMSFGPFSVTGGVVHAINEVTADELADLMIKYSAEDHEALSMIVSLIRGESDYDPNADNPNHQDDEPGQTTEQKAEHEDIGIAQFDLNTIMGLPQFKGWSLAQIRAKAFDPEWAVPYACNYLSDSLDWARTCFAEDPSLRGKVPNGDYRILAFQSYNAGRTGALHIAHTQGNNPDSWHYGLAAINRYNADVKMLGE